MKYTFTVVALFSIITLSAQEKTTLRIKQEGFGKSHGLSLIFDGQSIPVSPTGELLLETEIPLNKPTMGVIELRNGEYGFFWIEPGHGEVSIYKKGFPETISVNGSESHAAFQALQFSETTEEFVAAFKANASNRAALFFLNNVFKTAEIQREILQELYDNAGEAEKQQLPAVAAYLATADIPRVKVNTQMHHFEGSDYEGQAFDTRDYPGKYLLLDFSATWCGPCWTGYPELIKTVKKYPNVQVITVMEDDNIQRYNELKKKGDLAIDWPVIWQMENKQGLHDIYEVMGWPTFLFISPEGKVIDRWSGLSNWPLNKRVKQLLKSK